MEIELPDGERINVAAHYLKIRSRTDFFWVRPIEWASERDKSRMRVRVHNNTVGFPNGRLKYKFGEVIVVRTARVIDSMPVPS